MQRGRAWSLSPVKASNLPLVAPEMSGAAIPAYGGYDIRMSADGNDGPLVTVYVAEKPRG